MRTLLMLILSGFALSAWAGDNDKHSDWVTTWTAAPQSALRDDKPHNPDLSDRSLRQVIRVSAGGEALRLRLSNVHTPAPVEIKSIYIAPTTDSCCIDVKSAKYLTFGKKKSVTIEAGGTAVSDELPFSVGPLQQLSVTICYGSAPKEATSHLGSRSTSYILEGEAKPKRDFANGERVDHWYNIAAIDVRREPTEVIAVIGNSITDSYCSTPDKNRRWTDVLAERLHADGVEAGVLNLGIDGNSVLSDGWGTGALNRFDRDILAQHGVTKVVIFEGVNDMGWWKSSEDVANKLIEAYKVLAAKAHAKGLQVYGATITPFLGHYYYTHFHEAARRTVNDWIRESDCFDGVLDFDMLTRNPIETAKMREEWQMDWLHPNDAGYKAMGEYAAKVLQGK